MLHLGFRQLTDHWLSHCQHHHPRKITVSLNTFGDLLSIVGRGSLLRDACRREYNDDYNDEQMNMMTIEIHLFFHSIQYNNSERQDNSNKVEWQPLLHVAELGRGCQKKVH